MLHTYEILPRRSAGPVHLGMSREEARVAMGGPPQKSFPKRPHYPVEIDSYHEASFRIFYDGDEPKVNYVEMSAKGEVDAVFRGVHVFQTKASELIAIVSETDHFDDQDPELGYSYIFPTLDLAFWRPMLPDDEPDCEFFQAVGTGTEGYYAKRVT